MGTKVTLRQKTISKGRKSLYLDFYPPIIQQETGEPTRREFLGLYIFDVTTLDKNGKEKKVVLNHIDKKHNEETLVIANNIRQKRENELNKPEIYNDFEREQLRIKKLGEEDFIQYFQKLADRRKDSNRDAWLTVLKYLNDFVPEGIKFNDLDEKFCNEFKNILLNSKSKRTEKTLLATNSAVSYFNKFKAALKQAHNEGILQYDLNARIKPIKPEETNREFLTIEELNMLANTPCNDLLLKRAAIFSALTGLRFSDIQKLTWGEIQFTESGYIIQFRQKKTKGVEYLPISKQAFSILGDPEKPLDRVFEGLTYSAYSNKHLFQWIGKAGITKNITFHCFRHTFAVLQLANGTDIYTVSKMLGHRELKTTQIYAKVVDKAKREAADKIKLNL